MENTAANNNNTNSDLSENETTTSNKKVARKTKLEIAAEKLPEMSETVASEFNRLSASLETNDLDSLAAHLSFESRRRRLTASLINQVEVGKVVRVVSGPLGLVGKTGVVTESKRVRCYVEVDGERVYLFHSDVELVDGVTVEVGAANDPAGLNSSTTEASGF